jgi:short-subunit dehydrogenase
VSSVHPVLTKTGFHDAAARHSGGKLKIGRSAKMQSAETVADAIVKCLVKPRGEVWTSTGARFGLGFSVMAPRLTDRVLLRMQGSHQK